MYQFQKTDISYKIQTNSGRTYGRTDALADSNTPSGVNSLGKNVIKYQIDT